MGWFDYLLIWWASSFVLALAANVASQEAETPPTVALPSVAATEPEKRC